MADEWELTIERDGDKGWTFNIVAGGEVRVRENYGSWRSLVGALAVLSPDLAALLRLAAYSAAVNSGRNRDD